MRIKKRKPLYKDGDYLIESDLTGRICYASETRKMWNGLICHRDEYEERNPQDFIKAIPEREPFKEVRPRKTGTYVEVSADDL